MENKEIKNNLKNDIECNEQSSKVNCCEEHNNCDKKTKECKSSDISGSDSERKRVVNEKADNDLKNKKHSGGECNCNHTHNHSNDKSLEHKPNSEEFGIECSCYNHDHGNLPNSSHNHRHKNIDGDNGNHHRHDDDDFGIECSCCHNHSHDHSDGVAIECGCGHDHGSKEHKSLPQWVLYVRMAIAAVLLAIGAIIEHVVHSEPWSIALYAVANVIIGYDIYIRMFKNIIKGRIFDENFLMIVAAIAAFVIGEGLEGVMVLLLYQVGETLQDRASDKSVRAIGNILDIRADTANLEIDGAISEVDSTSVNVGDIVVIKAGEKIPLDGTIIEGETYVNTVALTGESVPKSVSVGDEILAGCINTGGAIRMRVDKIYSESTASKIVATVKNINKQKSGTEKFITRFAKYYTPIVVIAAFLVALVPSLIPGNDPREWVYRAITFLVISCPCALVISVPMSYFGGIGSASKRGILIKGGVHIDSLASVKSVVMDKTGTLTQGVFTVSKIVANGISEEELLRYAAEAEFYSNHPIAKAITEYVGLTHSDAKDITELAGHGLIGTYKDKQLLVGNDKLMRSYGIECEDIIGTAIHVAYDGQYCGYIIISDIIKYDAKAAVSALHKLGVKVTMLTGDNENAAAGIAKEVGIDNYYSELLPLDKVDKFNAIKEQNTAKVGTKTVFVGDGINDTPVLVVADVGIAMGGLGADAAIESADAVIMNDEPMKVVTAIRISKKTKRIVMENIVFSLGVKLVVLILGGLGIANIWLALFADVGVSVLAVFNALRCLRLNDNFKYHKKLKSKKVKEN